MMDSGDMHDGTGWAWGWWMFGFALMVAIVVLVVVLVVRLTGSARSASPPEPVRRAAEDVLADRLARGEIDTDEYRQRREALRSD